MYIVRFSYPSFSVCQIVKVPHFRATLGVLNERHSTDSQEAAVPESFLPLQLPDKSADGGVILVSVFI